MPSAEPDAKSSGSAAAIKKNSISARSPPMTTVSTSAAASADGRSNNGPRPSQSPNAKTRRYKRANGAASPASSFAMPPVIKTAQIASGYDDDNTNDDNEADDEIDGEVISGDSSADEGEFAALTRNFYVVDRVRNMSTRQGPRSWLRRRRARGFMCNSISTAKYTLVGFLFKFLFEQFNNYANLFFLITAVLQQIPGITPTNKFDTALPLIVVLAVTGVKEIAEDIRRHRSDDEVNQRASFVLVTREEAAAAAAAAAAKTSAKGNAKTKLRSQGQDFEKKGACAQKNIPRPPVSQDQPTPAGVNATANTKKSKPKKSSSSTRGTGSDEECPEAPPGPILDDESTAAPDGWLFCKRKWKDIVVGDIVRVAQNEFFPADLILLSTSDCEGICYVDTCNLDGETNLKIRQALPETRDISSYTGARVCCELPNSSLYTFEASLHLNDYSNVPSFSTAPQASPPVVPFGPKQLLLRGSRLRNTKYVIGLVVFTGHETKLMRNASAAPIKTTKVHHITNIQILVLCVILLALAIFCAIATSQSSTTDVAAFWYLPAPYGSMVTAAVASGNGPPFMTKIATLLSDVATFWVLYSNLVPISLIVTMELVKFLNADLISCDKKIADPVTGAHALVKTSALVEELGQVEYLFSDKTGTLTCNIMEFQECCVSGLRYSRCLSGPSGTSSSGKECENPRAAKPSTEKSHKDCSGDPSCASANAISKIHPGSSSYSAPVSAPDTAKNTPVRGPSPQPAEAIPTDVIHEITNVQDCYSLAVNADIPTTMSRRQADDLFETCSLSTITSLASLTDFQSVYTQSDTFSGPDFLSSAQKNVFSPSTSPFSSAQSSSTQIKLRDFNDLRNVVKSDNSTHGETCREFLTLLSVCHSVLPEVKDGGKITYQASSPDEAALVSTSAEIGYKFVARTPNMVTVDPSLVFKPATPGEDTKLYFRLLAMNEFNSTRKRMSVLVEKNGRYTLYVKGADSAIFPLLSPDVNLNPVESGAKCLNALDYYATQGLRTLTLAYKHLEKDVAEAWLCKYNCALASMTKRADMLDAAAAEIEKGLTLLGATAVEDKLQDGVPETIAKLAAANIRIWMLTGDRLETAVNIGFSCQLLTQKMRLITIGGDGPDGCVTSVREILKKLEPLLLARNDKTSNSSPDLKAKVKGNEFQKSDEKDCGANPSFDSEKSSSSVATQQSFRECDLVPHALIIDGAALGLVIDHPDFIKAACAAACVICCRVSPLQKALVVKAVRGHTKAITLSIGDGANDVSMIQAANIGIGIAGLEGMQAARCADVAISQFRFLERILLVHGCYSYQRLTRIILYSFYKNTTLYLTQFWFALYNAFSGQTLYESWILSAFNVIFTSTPPLAMGVFDRVLNEEALQLHPGIYRIHQSGRKFNVRVFWSWILNSVFHSLIAFYGVQLFLGSASWRVAPLTLNNNSTVQSTKRGFEDGVHSQGHVGGIWITGAIMYTVVLLIVLCKIALATTLWVFPYTYVSIFGSATLWFVLFPIYAAFSSAPSSILPSELNGAHMIFGELRYWLIILIIPVIALLRDYVIKYLRGIQKPSMLREEQIRQRKLRKLARESQRAVSFAALTQPGESTAKKGAEGARAPVFRGATRKYRSSFAFSQSSDQRIVIQQQKNT